MQISESSQKKQKIKEELSAATTQNKLTKLDAAFDAFSKKKTDFIKLNIQAEEDLTRIFEYGIGQFGLKQAEKYYEMFFDCFYKIALNPFLFPNANHYKIGYRYCVCGADTIFYKINSDEIEIMAILGRQNF